MPRLPAMLLAALAGTAHAPWGGMDQNLLDCEYDLPQHACPTCEGAPLGLAGGMPDAVVALTPRCIEAEGGCCEHDGFEYFLKASLARYQSGNVVSFFYPGKADMVSWVARDDAMAGGREDRGSISAPGRCVWSNDWTVRPPARRVTRARPPRDVDLTPVRARSGGDCSLPLHTGAAAVASAAALAARAATVATVATEPAAAAVGAAAAAVGAVVAAMVLRARAATAAAAAQLLRDPELLVCAGGGRGGDGRALRPERGGSRLHR